MFVFMFHLFRRSLAQNSTLILETKLQSLKFCSISRNQHNPTISYLIERCGLSLDTALSVSSSKKIQIGTTENPDSVIELFKTYDITQPQITKLITNNPKIIFSQSVKTLKPKIDFLKSSGLSIPNIALLLSSSNFVARSLKSITPVFSLVRKFLLCTNKDIAANFRDCSYVFSGNYLAVQPNISVLQDYGVPDANIGKLLVINPRAVTVNNDRFKEICSDVEEMGLDPKRSLFVLATGIMGKMSKLCWENKIKVFKSFGLTEDDIISAFKRQPNFMATSEEKIRKLMDFYLNELGFTASDVSKHPSLMVISMEKRIIPRCSVLQVLLSRGLIEKDIHNLSALVSRKKEFEKRYVHKNQDIAPEVLKAYRGEPGYPKYGTLREIFK